MPKSAMSTAWVGYLGHVLILPEEAMAQKEAQDTALQPNKGMAQGLEAQWILQHIMLK
jgi:hypothetical protein